MNEWHDSLRKFRIRVRIARAWRGFAVGATFGALLCATWAGLDWLGWYYTEWAWLGAMLATCGGVGFALGLALPVRDKALGDSIDRRAGLHNRVGTALEGPQAGLEFLHAQREDALTRLRGLRPSSLYPLKLYRLHAALVALCGLAALMFVLGNTPLLLSEERQKDREELQKSATSVERVARPVLDDVDGAKPEERDVANDIERLARELQKGRIDKDEALQKANELARKADELSRKRYGETQDLLTQAETAKDKVAREELSKQGLDGADPSQIKADPSEMGAQRRRLEQKIQDLQNRLPNAKSGAGSERSQIEAALERAEKDLQTLELSQQARKTLEKLFSMKEWQDLQKLAKKLQEAAQEGKKGNDTLTPDQIKQMQKKLEELAKQLKDDKAMRDYIEKLREAMKKAQGG